MAGKTTLILIGLAAATVMAALPPQEGKAPEKVGVVSLKVLFEKYDRVKVVDAKLKRIHQEYLTRRKDIQTRLVKAKEQMELFRNAPRTLDEKMRLYNRAKADLEYEEKYGLNDYRRAYRELKIEIYNEIRQAVTAIGKEKGFDLIFRIDEAAIEGGDAEPISMRINKAVVLYHHDAMDITSLVLTRLNGEWTKRLAAGWNCPKCKKQVAGNECPACGEKKP